MFMACLRARRCLDYPLTFIGDLLQHRLALTEHLAVGKANDSVAQFVEVRRAS